MSFTIILNRNYTGLFIGFAFVIYNSVALAQSRPEIQRAMSTAKHTVTVKHKVVYRNKYVTSKSKIIYRDTLSAPADIQDPDNSWNDKDKVYYLGDHFDSDNSEKPDDNKAFRCYRRAAELGNVKGIEYVADFYQEGRGVKKNYALARQWYSRAVNLGDVDAMIGLGAMCRDGQGEKADKCKAMQLFKQAANTGDPMAMVILSEGYLDGDCSGKPDKELAKEILDNVISMSKVEGASIEAKGAGYSAARVKKRLLESYHVQK